MARRTRVRYVPNRRGQRELETRMQTGKAMLRIAEIIARRAEANGGMFTEGYAAERRIVGNTAGARAGTDHPFAHWDEWGNRYRAPRAPMRRALSSLGLLHRTRESGKP